MFMPGDTVTGVVELDLRDSYPAYSLKIGICGFKEVHFYHDPGSDHDVKVYNWDQLYQSTQTLATFSDLKPPINSEPIPGGYPYNFSITIPADMKTLHHPSFCQIH